MDWTELEKLQRQFEHETNELNELTAQISSDDFDKLEKIEKEHLIKQKAYTESLVKVLYHRIEYQRAKFKNEKPCYEAGDGSYDQAVGKCFK